MKKHKLFSSAAEKLACRFSLLIAVIIVVVSAAVIMLLRANIRVQQNRELVSSAERIMKLVQRPDPFRNSGAPGDEMPHPRGAGEPDVGRPVVAGLPYYITYSLYAGESLIDTNDPFLPHLPLTEGRPVRYRQKNFYTDGDLDILYCSKQFESAPGVVLTVQTALDMDRDTSLNMLARMPRVLVVFFLPLLVISYFAALLITKRTMRPVVQMTESARRISSANLGSLLPVTGSGDELDTLALTFNDLFSRLKKDFDSERQFTANVSHELKTPLAVILGQANLIRRWGKNDPAQLEKSIAALIDESHSMESIITNLLELSRIENGVVKPAIQTVEVLPLAERLANDTHAWSPDTLFNFSGIAADAAVTADPDLLYQVCTILVSNSVKFSPAPVSITVTVARSGGTVVLVLADSGPGFAEQIIPFVFDRFYRGDESHNRKNGGSGLGLSLAKVIMTAMNGTIGAGNTADHHARITLELPVPF